MRTISQQAFAPAPLSSPSLSSPLLWVPLDEVRQAWASFGAEALSVPALLATGTAFRALSWETSALRYHRLADQAQQRGGLFQDAAAPWLDLVVLDLSEAIRDWQSVQLWLERLASNRDTRPTCTEPLEQVRALSEQVTAQQERLHHLLEQMRQERSAYDRRQPAAPVAPLVATPAAAGAQEEEGVTWPNA